MSDPVTNVEIEDVLSSIRRLVSEDARARPEPQQRRQPDRLVLTPALRVKDEEPVQEPTEAAWRRDNDDGPAPVLPTGPSFDHAEHDAPQAPLGEDRIESTDNRDGDPDWDDEHDIGAADDDFIEDAAPRPAEVTETSALSRLVEQEIARAFEDSEDDEDDPLDRAAEADVDGQTREPFHADAFEFMVAADPDTAVAAAPADTVPEPDEEAGVSVFDASDDEEGLDVLPWTALQDEELQDEELQDEEEIAEPVAEAPQTELERKIAALEEMVARKAEDWDGESPDTGGNAAFVHRPVDVLDWRDDDVAPVPEPSGDAGSARAPAEQWYGDETATIDEDMLRDMVAEIVRQELQGALGERITRNVRKLVRREIHRVLMSQDFD